eukprot:GHUV01037394.1.p1 GENE.GHUV01037394.1~~GHUV01037394.1.p1  ORF type:complete len:106 (-),score=15.26 GHUV01037394.1:332-649(-)
MAMLAFSYAADTAMDSVNPYAAKQHCHGQQWCVSAVPGGHPNILPRCLSHCAVSAYSNAPLCSCSSISNATTQLCATIGSGSFAYCFNSAMLAASATAPSASAAS